MKKLTLLLCSCVFASFGEENIKRSANLANFDQLHADQLYQNTEKMPQAPIVISSESAEDYFIVRYRSVGELENGIKLIPRMIVGDQITDLGSVIVTSSSGFGNVFDELWNGHIPLAFLKSKITFGIVVIYPSGESSYTSVLISRNIGIGFRRQLLGFKISEGGIFFRLFENQKEPTTVFVYSDGKSGKAVGVPLPQNFVDYFFQMDTSVPRSITICAERVCNTYKISPDFLN